jgi:hypothetical protein
MSRLHPALLQSAALDTAAVTKNGTRNVVAGEYWQLIYVDNVLLAELSTVVPTAVRQQSDHRTDRQHSTAEHFRALLHASTVTS